MSVLKLVKPSTLPERTTRTTVDTIEITPKIVSQWEIPPFQRPLRVNAKVRAVGEAIKNDGGVIPGVMTLGVMDKRTWVLDGQHRREAFLLSGCEVGYVDVRFHYFNTMAEMGEEFVNLNSQLVRMRPDDIIRGLEGTLEPIAKLRKRCPFVGYDQIRRSDKAPILGMSALLRCWAGSSPEVPASGGISAQQLATQLTGDESESLSKFLDLAFQAWGRDQAYTRLWGALNLTVVMWLYRRTVIAQYSPSSLRLTSDLFKKCLMSLSAKSDYLDWLVGRLMTDRDRSPSYARIKQVFAARIETETGSKPRLPSPAWATTHK